MKIVFRWFGEGNDKISLDHIRQIPCINGVVTSLLDIPAGEVWPQNQLFDLKKKVEAYGLSLEVIESVNIHEDIKLGTALRDKYIEAYIKTLQNLSLIGIKVVCYNFMPVLDWARSDLAKVLSDGSNTMYYNNEFIMEIKPQDLALKFGEQSNGFALPGWEPERLKLMSETIQKYDGMTEEKYFGNIKYFLDAIIPYAEKYDIKMAIHPDDPPWPIFGLTRVITNRDSIVKFLELNKSPYNGLTICTGSLGANKDNNVAEIVREFSAAGRLHFIHLRNLKFESDKDFYESAHPSACGSLNMFDIVKALHDTGYIGYMRPDHGRMVWGETGRPGYGLYDRAMGITYIHGLWEAIGRMSGI